MADASIDTARRRLLRLIRALTLTVDNAAFALQVSRARAWKLLMQLYHAGICERFPEPAPRGWRYRYQLKRKYLS